ncbi:hypothetical protein H4R18_001083 [Coemansia javaensis]|uniref:AB hydrolase-1 domain-containing protein n=1 Tax=Coemansia javaensis TaxID=2761396 RepID=A0A9W8HEX1_9FUNG|nr:hypothetical protein H4R18_001083 [Coemansia javaensis]
MVCYFRKWYAARCRIQLLLASEKTSAVVRHTESEGMVTLHDMLYTECPSLTDPERAHMTPTPYLATGLLQTIYATLRVRLRDKESDVSYVRELLVMADGGTVSLDWHTDASLDNADAPIVMVMAGVGGSSREHYIRVVVRALAHSAAGFRVVVFNHRGTAHTPITSARPYDQGFTEDFRAAVKHVRAANPDAKLVGVAFSMGANILTKYIGEEGPRCTLAGAVTVCCPFDVKVTSAAIDESNMLNNHVFQPAVMRTVMRAIERGSHLPLDPAWNLDIDKIMSAKRLSVVEKELITKICGHKSIDEYYENASSIRYVDSIEVPFLAINSLDDRITPARGIPVDKFKTNPNIALVLTPHGGHLGFLTGIPPRIWLTTPIVEFASAVVK